jgi:hypothetical protein
MKIKTTIRRSMILSRIIVPNAWDTEMALWDEIE